VRGEDERAEGLVAGVPAVEGGVAGEQELADVGDGHGVAALDAFTGELADEVAEKGVDGIGSGEVGQVAEEFCGVFIVLLLLAVLELACVVRAEFQIGKGREETAMVAAPIDVAARSESDGMGNR
jgi:hypothetical protein